jgi:hypothetical protein
MDLIGIPIRITIGNKIDEHIVELKKRDSDEIKEISIFDVLYFCQQLELHYNYQKFCSIKEVASLI